MACVEISDDETFIEEQFKDRFTTHDAKYMALKSKDLFIKPPVVYPWKPGKMFTKKWDFKGNKDRNQGRSRYDRDHRSHNSQAYRSRDQERDRSKDQDRDRSRDQDRDRSRYQDRDRSRGYDRRSREYNRDCSSSQY